MKSYVCPSNEQIPLYEAKFSHFRLPYISRIPFYMCKLNNAGFIACQLIEMSNFLTLSLIIFNFSYMTPWF